MTSKKKRPTPLFTQGLLTAAMTFFSPLASCADSTDLSPLLLDLQFEVITQTELDPWVSACIADQFSSQWLLPSRLGTPVSEVVQDRANDAVRKCREARFQTAPQTGTVGDGIRDVGAAVSGALNKNAKARLRLAEEKKAIRSCMATSKDTVSLQECLDRSNIRPLADDVLSKLYAVFALWGK